MTLGQMIQHLRREKGMLQDELAEILGVSRQSVSKWETDTAVPELDRLLQLSELFGVTLDELVRGEAPPSPEPESAPAVEPQPAPVQPASWPPRKIAGTILLCFGGLVWLLLTVVFGDLLGALTLASPFLVCGVICFILRRRVGLWCAWAMYVLVDAYLRWATGTYRREALMFSHYAWQSPVRLMLAWALMLGLIVLIAVTLRSYRSQTAALDRYTVLWFGLCLLPFLIRAGYIAIFPHYIYPLDFPGFILYAAGFLLEWLTIAAFTTLLVRLAAVLRGRRAK